MTRVSKNSKAWAIEMTNINKIFVTKKAVDNVDFKVTSGEIHGLVGENGAGKSTLMNLLYGFHRMNSGSVKVFGSPVVLRSPADAIGRKIGMVHQHFMLVDRMSVTENMIIGKSKGFIEKDLDDAKEKLEFFGAKFGLTLDPTSSAEELPVGLQQRLEIVKVLYRGAKILILDEPTAVLTPQEISGLFDILRELKGNGVTIILITHKLREIMEITDTVSVMRAGKMVGTWKTKKLNTDKLAKLMIGRNPTKPTSRKIFSSKQGVLMKVRDLTVLNDKNAVVVDNVSFDLHKGEMLGLAGISGNGQTELVECITGMRKQSAGTITINGHIFSEKDQRDASVFRSLGVANVPEDRLNSMVSEMSSVFNYLLGYQKQDNKFFINWKQLLSKLTIMMKKFDVRPQNPNLTFNQFSGGNQQKFVLAKEIEKNLPVIVASQPTRGVDIGSIESIHAFLMEHRNKGGAVFLSSAELDEIITLADRIIIMYQGKIVGEKTAKKISAHDIGLLMMGGTSNKKNAKTVNV